MSLSTIAINKPVFSWMLFISTLFFGAIGFNYLGINDNPDVDFPVVSIRYEYDGATPAVVEKDILEPVENVLVTMQGIQSMTSQGERGSGRITIEFSLNKDIDFALQEVQTLLGRAQRSLPDQVNPPTVTKSNASDDPIMYLALSSSTLDERELMILFRDRIQDRISTVEGVAEVRAFGYHEPMLRIDLNLQALSQYQLTPSDIVNSIEREHLELPAGRFEMKEEERSIRVMGEGRSLEDFQNLTISRRGGGPNFRPIFLKDVAHVYEGIENVRRTSRVNGVFSMGMAVLKQRGVNAVSVADQVLERMGELNSGLGSRAQLSLNFNRTQFVKESVRELIQNLLLSALFTSIVCWLFLKSISATVNILLAIPFAVMGTFAFMKLFDFTLNTFTLLGLSLAIGIVVDDAIVMLENITRYADLGFNKVKAALKGSTEITFAVIATTLALIAIFAPITLMPGIEGRFFYEFAITLCLAVGLSSVEALTLTPMRCSQYLNIKAKGLPIHQWVDKVVTSMREAYRNSLAWSLNNNKKVVGFGFALFLLSLATLPFIPKEFAPNQDTGVIFTIFIAPDGKSMAYTDEKVKLFEKVAMGHPDVERVFVSVGGFGRGGSGNRGNGIVILKDQSIRSKSQIDVAADLKNATKDIDGLRIILRDRGSSPFSGRRGSPVEFTIKGPDPNIQKEIFKNMGQLMEESPIMSGVRSDDTTELPEILILPDRNKALLSGIEVAEIAKTVNLSLGGVSVAQYTKEGRRFDLFVQARPEDRESSGSIEEVLIRNNRSELLKLKEVVQFQDQSGPQQIFREDRERGVRVDANLNKGAVLGDAVKFIESIKSKVLPKDYRIEFSKNLDNSLLSILLIIFVGLCVSYMVLGSQFNSFVDPFLVFLAVPFGISGGLIALILGGQSINAYSMIGMLLTLGLVKKNSILLVEFTNQLRDQGKDQYSALLEACPLRFRPILMTTLSTVAAALPPAFSGGPGSETRIPMALVVIGGVLTSTLFTLYVIPCVYNMLSPKRFRLDMEN